MVDSEKHYTYDKFGIPLVDNLLKTYEEIYCIDLDNDYYKIVYPEENLAECGNYSEAVLRHFANEKIAELNEKTWDFLSVENIREALSRKEYTEAEYARTSLDGQKRLMHTQIVADESTDGNVHKAFMYIRPVDNTIKTDKKRCEPDADIFKDEEAAGFVKTDFISTISHDIRTTLNGIIGMSNLAMESIAGVNNSVKKGSFKSELQEHVYEYLAKILQSSYLIRGLVNNVLDMTKIERNEMRLNYEPFNIEEFENVIDTVIRVECAKRHIEFETDYSGAVSAIMLDKLKLNQIVLNLLSNAVKYTKAGGRVKFSVSSEEIKESDKVKLKIVVSDTGVGMSRSFMKVMYNAFAQEQNDAISHCQGSGLGLSIVKNLVELMGGKIKCESAVGKGTTFYLEFECDKVNDSGLVTETDSEKLYDEIRGMRVLITEDNNINLEIEEELLKIKGVETYKASNGLEAVELFTDSSENFFDAIFMDIRMPVLDGIEATKRIRAMKRIDASQVPIIAITGNAFDHDMDKGVSVGITDYLLKPYDPSQMYDILLRYKEK